MFWIALRLHRVGALGYAGFMALNVVANVSAWPSLNDTAAKQAAFGAQMKLLAPSFSLFVPDPLRPDTFWGFNEWKGWALGLLAFSIWAVVAGSGVVRGEEERGLLESWLTTGLRRRWLVLQRAAAFAVMLVLAIAVGGAAPSVAIALSGGIDVPWIGLLIQTLAMTVVSFFFFGLAAGASSLFATRRNAGGAAAVVMLAAFVLAGVARTTDSVKPFRWLSPFSYYDRVHALAPGGTVDWWAIVVPAAAGVGLVLLAAWLLHWRDVGAVLVPRRRADAPPGVTPERNPLYRLPVLPGLWDQRVGLTLWAAGIFVDGYWLTSVSRSMLNAFGGALQGNTAGVVKAVLGLGAAGNPYAGIVSTVVLPQTLLVVAAFAIYQASRWTAEDSDGRLEMLLATGFARWQVIAERAVALLAGAAVLAAADFLAIWLAGRVSNLGLDSGALLLAVSLELPLALAFGAAGSALAAWRPRVAVALMSLVAFSSYFLPFVAPFFSWPDWVHRLSLFDLYGKPMVDGVYWNGLLATLALGLGCLVIATAMMQRREVGR